MGHPVRMDAMSRAVRLARRLGVSVDMAVPLRSTNNIVAWLRPSPIVAKVSTHKARSSDELAVAQRLSEANAPVVPPTDVVDPGVHDVGGCYVTLWRHVVPDDAPPSSAAVAASLLELHRALRLPGVACSRPSFKVQLTDALRALREPGFAPDLGDGDRDLLGDALVTAVESFEPDFAEKVIHGSPHRFNILAVDHQALFIDFETVQHGLLEWDLAHLEPDVAQHYADEVDPELLARCRVALSATTATWCWAGLHRGPDMQAHADHHLARVRAAHPWP